MLPFFLSSFLEYYRFVVTHQYTYQQEIAEMYVHTVPIDLYNLNKHVCGRKEMPRAVSDQFLDLISLAVVLLLRTCSADVSQLQGK